MTYNVQCPGCGEDFEVEKTAEQLADEDDLTKCPNCDLESESDYYPDTDTLELLDIFSDEDDEEDEEDSPAFDDYDNDEDEEDDDEDDD